MFSSIVAILSSIFAYHQGLEIVLDPKKEYNKLYTKVVSFFNSIFDWIDCVFKSKDNIDDRLQIMIYVFTIPYYIVFVSVFYFLRNNVGFWKDFWSRMLVLMVGFGVLGSAIYRNSVFLWILAILIVLIGLYLIFPIIRKKNRFSFEIDEAIGIMDSLVSTLDHCEDNNRIAVLDNIAMNHPYVVSTFDDTSENERKPIPAKKLTKLVLLMVFIIFLVSFLLKYNNPILSYKWLISYIIINHIIGALLLFILIPLLFDTLINIKMPEIQNEIQMQRINDNNWVQDPNIIKSEILQRFVKENYNVAIVYLFVLIQDFLWYIPVLMDILMIPIIKSLIEVLIPVQTTCPIGSFPTTEYPSSFFQVMIISPTFICSPCSYPNNISSQCSYLCNGGASLRLKKNLAFDYIYDIIKPFGFIVFMCIVFLVFYTPYIMFSTIENVKKILGHFDKHFKWETVGYHLNCPIISIVSSLKYDSLIYYKFKLIFKIVVALVGSLVNDRKFSVVIFSAFYLLHSLVLLIERPFIDNYINYLEIICNSALFFLSSAETCVYHSILIDSNSYFVKHMDISSLVVSFLFCIISFFYYRSKKKTFEEFNYDKGTGIIDPRIKKTISSTINESISFRIGKMLIIPLIFYIFGAITFLYPYQLSIKRPHNC